MTEGRAAASRIAVLRANGIGDFIFALPALDALRAAHPDAEIVLLGLPWHERFLAGRPGPVDRVVVVPGWPGVRDDEPPERAKLRAFFAKMSKSRYDLAIQMHGGGRNSNPFVRRLRATRAVGLRAADAPSLDACVPYRYFQSEVQRCLEVAELAGARPLSAHPHLCVTAADVAEAERVVPPDGRPLALLNPGAGDPRRRWPTDRFAEVGRALVEAGAHVAVAGGAEDVALSASIAREIRNAVSVAGRLTLGGLAGACARSAVVVSNDSGPLHLAEAVGTPTVGVYWCGNVINAAPATRSRHRIAMSWRLRCPECGVDCMRGSCEHDASFVAEVPAAEVAEEALSLLATAARTPHRRPLVAALPGA